MFSDITFQLTQKLESVSTLCLFFSVFSRIHPDHNDDGGVCAARCHDSHSRGRLSCHLDLDQTGFADGSRSMKIKWDWSNDTSTGSDSNPV